MGGYPSDFYYYTNVENDGVYDMVCDNVVYLLWSVFIHLYTYDSFSSPAVIQPPPITFLKLL